MLKEIDGAYKSVILDLSTVELVDSIGISLVVGLFKSCQSKNMEFSVEGANENLLRVFALFKLPQFFPIQGA